MKKFQYITFKRDLSEEELNILGNDGWKLVSHVEYDTHLVPYQYFIFKREINKIMKKIKNSYPTIITTLVLIINAIVVYFGRIYFPVNFSPETVTFFENYWVLTLGLCFVVGLITICLFGLWKMGSELIKDIKSIRKYMNDRGVSKQKN